MQLVKDAQLVKLNTDLAVCRRQSNISDAKFENKANFVGTVRRILHCSPSDISKGGVRSPEDRWISNTSTTFITSKQGLYLYDLLNLASISMPRPSHDNVMLADMLAMKPRKVKSNVYSKWAGLMVPLVRSWEEKHEANGGVLPIIMIVGMSALFLGIAFFLKSL